MQFLINKPNKIDISDILIRILKLVVFDCSHFLSLFLASFQNAISVCWFELFFTLIQLLLRLRKSLVEVIAILISVFSFMLVWLKLFSIIIWRILCWCRRFIVLMYKDLLAWFLLLLLVLIYLFLQLSIRLVKVKKMRKPIYSYFIVVVKMGIFAFLYDLFSIILWPIVCSVKD